MKDDVASGSRSRWRHREYKNDIRVSWSERLWGGLFALLWFTPISAQSVPLGLPPVPTLATSVNSVKHSALQTLGKRLFFDRSLSRDGTVSCATCHLPEKAFTDGLPVAQGIERKKGTRNTPTLLNAVYLPSQFWDGRRTSLEAQAKDPFVNPFEHAFPDHAAVTTAVHQRADYAPMFAAAFGTTENAVTIDQIAGAIAAFERTLLAGDSAFDRFLYAGQSTAMSSSAKRGWELFRGRARCITCHSVDNHTAMFTDHAFHRLGVGHSKVGANLAQLTMDIARVHHDAAQLDALVLRIPAVSELGRFVVTLQPKDIGAFRTPSLRNVALTAPYMHDGSVPTLADAVDLELYYRSGEQGRPLILTPQEKSDLVAFLESLTSLSQPWRSLDNAGFH